MGRIMLGKGLVGAVLEGVENLGTQLHYTAIGNRCRLIIHIQPQKHSS